MLTTRRKLIQEFQRYFSLREMVDEQTYKKYGYFAWNFIRTELLETLFVIRDQIVKKPMTINNWFMGGQYSQRGLRTNLSPLIMEKTENQKLSMSAHSLGAGVDFDVKGMTANEVRELIKANESKLPHPIRLEDDKSAPTWVHIDMYNNGEKSKIVLFNV